VRSQFRSDPERPGRDLIETDAVPVAATLVDVMPAGSHRIERVLVDGDDCEPFERRMVVWCFSRSEAHKVANMYDGHGSRQIFDGLPDGL
jgi:hypothetical protein